MPRRSRLGDFRRAVLPPSEILVVNEVPASRTCRPHTPPWTTGRCGAGAGERGRGGAGERGGARSDGDGWGSPLLTRDSRSPYQQRPEPEGSKEG